MRRTSAVAFALIGVAGAAGVVVGARAAVEDPAFDHVEHAGLFPTCLSCHRGAAETGASVFPSPSGCAECHDGQRLDRVDWRPREGPRPTNLVFAHEAHADEVAAERPDLDPVGCVDCHAPEAAPWMTVERAVVDACLACHELRLDHLALAPADCATCHSDLALSSTLLASQVADFPAPASHDVPDFALAHGGAVDATCAVCHARDFCVQCHVDAPERPEIVAMASDARSLALIASMPLPESHEAPGFVYAHGDRARSAATSCAACHTSESCTTCHIGTPQLADALPAAGPGRGVGAEVTRARPASHDAEFLTAHGPEAAARPETCAGCHVRSDCTECHRPGAPAGRRFHAADFLARHPAAAYNRETSCAGCHATGEFCQSCHASAGLAATDVLTSSFHDGQAAFSVGHGGAARMNLETCTSCHVERDCLACHSSTGGRGISPHGPDFDAEALRRANPQMCTACHGTEGPAGP